MRRRRKTPFPYRELTEQGASFSGAYAVGTDDRTNGQAIPMPLSGTYGAGGSQGGRQSPCPLQKYVYRIDMTIAEQISSPPASTPPTDSFKNGLIFTLVVLLSLSFLGINLLEIFSNLLKNITSTHTLTFSKDNLIVSNLNTKEIKIIEVKDED